MLYLYSALIIGTIGFQIALIFGAPWGRLTQGGQVEGSLPRAGRIGAFVSIFILLGMLLAVLSAAGNWPSWPIWTGWVSIAIHSIMTILNWITRSPPERRLWGPLTTLMLILVVMIVLT